MKLFTKRFVKDLFLIGIFSLMYYVLTHNAYVYPKLENKVGSWSIEMSQRPLALRLAGHNFLVLRNDKGEVVSELHGLATDVKTNTWKHVGMGNEEVLKVWEFDKENARSINGDFPGITLISGTSESMLKLWDEARVCAESINKEEIKYPAFGISTSNTTNSNAVAYTLTKCMNIEMKNFGLIVPGRYTDLLNK
jgi:hypothetical protein